MNGKIARFEAARILLFTIFATVAYGVLHDQVTAHLCVEYFTIAHPPLFPTESPFLLALGWGFVSTWWVGLLLGTALAAAARLGAWPRLGLGDVRRPILLVMLASAIAACLTGAAGAIAAAQGAIPLAPEWRQVIPAGKHVAFAAVAWAHMASYLAGAAGGAFVIFLTIRRRAASRNVPAGRTS
ncbi:MAG: hypothetical protein ACK4K7_14805 [Allosphingosinicella sp.]|uniref:hypothetical protein n=1 Tax=Allosphingosinicella sp. TaxID=2823234 RepID=UPI0039426F99